VKMAEGREGDKSSPNGSSPVPEDIFSTGPESEVPGTGDSPYSFTSSATISIFSSDFHSEDQQIEDLLGPSLTISGASPSAGISSQPNGGNALSPSNSPASSGAPSSSSEGSSPVS